MSRPPPPPPRARALHRAPAPDQGPGSPAGAATRAGTGPVRSRVSFTRSNTGPGAAPAHSRRRVLRILAAGAGITAGLGGGVLGLRQLGAAAPVPARWQGEVLGALSAMTLWHPRQELAERALLRMRIEIARLDQVFSLYRPDSALVALNRDGRLEQAPADLIQVLDAALQMAAKSGGAFDPTIQPLWLHHASGSSDPRKLAAARALVGHDRLDLGSRQIGFLRPGMGVSLNGIAQGYITDRITALLANEGFDQAMIELGETRALGASPGGAPFPVGIVDPLAPGRITLELGLTDQALAVSGGYGTRLPAPARHHIFDPATGLGAGGTGTHGLAPGPGGGIGNDGGSDPPGAGLLVQVAVTAPRAMLADALSTAIYVAGETAAPALLAAHPGASALIWHADGGLLRAG